MLYIFMGPSCAGKSTTADKMKELYNAEVFAGKDYLRIAKNESEAWKIFYEKLEDAALSKESVVYVITEKEHLNKVSTINSLHKVRFTASLEVIKSRFAKRMNGNLPQALEKKLEKQFEEWKNEVSNMVVDTTENINIEGIVESIVKL